MLEAIKAGKSPYDVQGYTKQALSPYIRQLKAQNFIAKKGYGVWQVNKEVKEILDGVDEVNISKPTADLKRLFTRPQRPITNLHALQILIPILSGRIDDSKWSRGKGLRHWTPTQIALKAPIAMKIQNNNHKSILVRVQSHDLNSLDEIDKEAFKVRIFLHDYFKKQGVILDILNAVVKNMDIATEDKKIEPMRRKSDRFELDLGKKAEKTFEKDNRDAKAWLDGSPFKNTAETNDKEWARAYLLMPFTVQKNSVDMKEYNENLKLHVSVMKKIGEYFDGLKR